MNSKTTTKTKPQLQSADIIEVRRETKDTHTLRLVLSQPFEWLPGQFIMVRKEINGVVVSRAYSISSSPTRSDYLEITIRQTDTPTMSKFLNEVKVGEQLTVKGPYGRFIWNEKVTEKVFCLGAGSGITPFRAYYQYILDKDLSNPIKLLYSCRYGDNVIFEKELLELHQQVKHSDYKLTITRDKKGLDYVGEGRINEKMLQKEIVGFEDANYYICGAPGFVKTMMSTLESLGIPKKSIKREQWG